MKKQITTILLSVLSILGVWAQSSVKLPTPVYLQDFEKATSPSDVGTLIGNGSIVVGDPVYGRYYQNMPNAAVATTRGNYLAMPDQNAFLKVQDTNSGEISVCFWVNTKVHMDKNFGLGWNAMFTAYTDEGFTGAGHEYRSFDLRVNGSSHARQMFYFYHNTWDSNPAYVDNTKWASDKGWHYVSYVMDQNCSHVVYYIDGEPIENFIINPKDTADFNQAWTEPRTNAWIANQTENFWKYLGQTSTIVLGGLSGEWADPDVAFGFDDVAIYSQALTPVQIKKIMTMKKGKADATTYFERKSKTLVPGSTFTQVPTTTSDATGITYQSSNTKVATVNAKTGEVKAVAYGTAVITATIPETDFFKASTAQYTIRVNAVPYPETLNDYSFDDANSPVLNILANGTEVRSNPNYDYTRTVNGQTSTFCNNWGANNNNWNTVFPLDAASAAEAPGWQLEFDWSGVGGCNTRAGVTTVTASGTELINISDPANWGGSFTMNYGDQSILLEVAPANRDTRISSKTALEIKPEYWHHFILTGSAAGVFITVYKYDANGNVLTTPLIDNQKIQDTNLIPDEMNFKPSSCGSVALDNLTFEAIEVKNEFADYTIRYVDINGHQIKPDEIVTNGAIVGKTFTANAKQMEDFKNEDGTIKYTYIGGNEELTANANSAKNIITLVFKEVEKFSYSIRATKNGSTLGYIVSDEFAYVGETILKGWSKYMQFNGKWYFCEEYTHEFTETSSVDIEFQDANITYFIEAEDMPQNKVSASVSGRSDFSNTKGAQLFAKETLTTPELIPAGTYNLTISTIARRTNEEIVEILYSATGEDGTWEPLCDPVTLASDNEGVKANYYGNYLYFPEAGFLRIVAGEYNMVHYIDYITFTESTSYTVHFKDENGNTIKDSVKHPATVGNTYSALPEDMESFTNALGDKRYEYVSGNIEQIANKKETDNGLTLTFRSLDIFSYGINAVCNGNIIGTLGEGKAFSDGSTTIKWSKYMQFNDKWYKTTNSTSMFAKTLDETYFANIEFEEATITDFTEAENMLRAGGTRDEGNPAAWVTGAEYSNSSAPRHAYNTYWWTPNTYEEGTYVMEIFYNNPNLNPSTMDIMTRDQYGNLFPTEGDIKVEFLAQTNGSVVVKGIKVPEGHHIVISNLYNNYNSNAYIDYVVITQPTTYTLKYQTIDGETIKPDSDPRNTNVGLKYSATDEEKADFYMINEDGLEVKYVFQYSDEEEEEKIAEVDPDENYIILYFNEYPRFDYTLQAVYPHDGENQFLKTIDDEIIYSDEPLTTFWSKYLEVDNKWYETNTFAQTIDGNGDYDIPFYPSDVRKFFECEDMVSSNPSSTLNLNTPRYSNGGSIRLEKSSFITSYPGDNATAEAKEAGKVPAGVYDIEIKPVYITAGNSVMNIE